MHMFIYKLALFIYVQYHMYTKKIIFYTPYTYVYKLKILYIWTKIHVYDMFIYGLFGTYMNTYSNVYIWTELHVYKQILFVRIRVISSIYGIRQCLYMYKYTRIQTKKIMFIYELFIYVSYSSYMDHIEYTTGLYCKYGAHLR